MPAAGADYRVPFAAVRTFSDLADDKAQEDYSRFVADVASVYARDTMAEFLRAL